MIKQSNQYPLLSNYFVCATTKTAKSKWRRIVVNGVITRYEMNKAGEIRNRDTGRMLQGYVGKPGYFIYLLTLNGKKISLFKHRLLACLFIPIPKHYLDMGYKQENLTINHKDGVKLNCDLSNLEWATSLENQLHALDNDLKGWGENATLAKHTETEIRQICELLQEGLHPREIVKITNVDIGNIWHVAYRRIWTRISKDYYFPNFEERQHDFSVVNNETVHEICRMLTETNLSFQEIADKFNITKEAVGNINNGRRHREITSLYDLPRKIEPPIQEDKIRHACELIQAGKMTLHQISSVSGVSKSTLARIKCGLRYSDIAKEYGIVSTA